MQYRVYTLSGPSGVIIMISDPVSLTTALSLTLHTPYTYYVSV